jgi:hypothetical protein
VDIDQHRQAAIAQRFLQRQPALDRPRQVARVAQHEIKVAPLVRAAVDAAAERPYFSVGDVPVEQGLQRRHLARAQLNARAIKLRHRIPLAA